MSLHDRAAQFAPFVALIGYDDAVAETARLTEARPKLDAQEQRAINERLAYIADHISEQPEARIKYFVPDEHKSGGTIIEVSGKVKKYQQQTEQSLWQMVTKYNYQTLQI